MRKIRVDHCVLSAVLFMVLAPVSWGQSSPSSPSTDVGARLTAVEQQAADAKSSADNAWMLTSAALVLMMTGPGLALFYGGLVRKKNVLSTMLQSFGMMAIISVLWALCGYSLAFSSGTSFIGGSIS
jgi:Amt family ammonium transporter